MPTALCPTTRHEKKDPTQLLDPLLAYSLGGAMRSHQCKNAHQFYRGYGQCKPLEKAWIDKTVAAVLDL